MDTDSNYILIGTRLTFQLQAAQTDSLVTSPCLHFSSSPKSEYLDFLKCQYVPVRIYRTTHRLTGEVSRHRHRAHSLVSACQFHYCVCSEHISECQCYLSKGEKKAYFENW